jgi:hypothetical protein
VIRWRDEAAYLGGRGLLESATLTRSHADDLAAVLLTADEDVVNLTDGARLSGYSADHLGRLLREGHIENVGRRRAPRIRVRDLPRKPRVLDQGRYAESIART